MSHAGEGGRTGGSRRWAPAIAVTAVVTPFLAGLPLVEHTLTRDQAPPAIKAPGKPPTNRSAAAPVTIEPAEGWSDEGAQAGMTRLRSGAATFAVEASATADCAQSEMARAAEARTDDPAVPQAGRAYVTSELEGTVRIWTGPTTEGLLFIACEDGVAFTVVARGPEGSLSDDGFAAVSDMLESMGPT